jgi:hypothetical protein
MTCTSGVHTECVTDDDSIQPSQFENAPHLALAALHTFLAVPPASALVYELPVLQQQLVTQAPLQHMPVAEVLEEYWLYLF